MSSPFIKNIQPCFDAFRSVFVETAVSFPDFPEVLLIVEREIFPYYFLHLENRKTEKLGKSSSEKSLTKSAMIVRCAELHGRAQRRA